jgi:hypothetical protein
VKAVILVPRRNDGGHRDELWRWCRAWWESNVPELKVVEGHHDEGLFNRSAAVNRAVAAAGDWDVAVLIDSDVICDPENVREAIERCYELNDRLVMPFTRRHNLNHTGTERIMSGDRGSWQRYIGKTYTQMCSSVVMIPRKLWDEVGGFDELFVGWGFEDTAFAAACETFGRGLERIEGECWHLWHPTAPEGKRDSPSYQANRARRELYSAALGDRKLMRSLINGESPRRPTSLAQENIPRIIHRVVPERTTEQVEAWWTATRKLHPGWELLTHRDPLEPNDWPMTSPYWSRCANGAQLAGLIRLEALYRYGGIYLDSDCEPYRSLEPLLSLHAFAAWEDERVVPDAVMGAEPEHPAIKECLDLAIKRLRSPRTDEEKSTWSTGPGVTTTVLPKRPDVLLLPPGSFYEVHYKDPDRDAKMSTKRPEPWIFVLHHYAGSWLKRAA